MLEEILIGIIGLLVLSIVIISFYLNRCYKTIKNMEKSYKEIANMIDNINIELSNTKDILPEPNEQFKKDDRKAKEDNRGSENPLLSSEVQSGERLLFKSEIRLEPGRSVIELDSQGKPIKYAIKP